MFGTYVGLPGHRVELPGVDPLDERPPLVVGELQGRAVRILAVANCDTLGILRDSHASLRVVLGPGRLDEVLILEANGTGCLRHANNPVQNVQHAVSAEVPERTFPTNKKYHILFEK